MTVFYSISQSNEQMVCVNSIRHNKWKLTRCYDVDVNMYVDNILQIYHFYRKIRNIYVYKYVPLKHISFSVFISFARFSVPVLPSYFFFWFCSYSLY